MLLIRNHVENKSSVEEIPSQLVKPNISLPSPSLSCFLFTFDDCCAEGPVLPAGAQPPRWLSTWLPGSKHNPNPPWYVARSTNHLIIQTETLVHASINKDDI
jgi:hypothetical protein